MKILILSTVSEGGGAFIAARNLHKALSTVPGVDADFVSLDYKEISGKKEIRKSGLIYYKINVLLEYLINLIFGRSSEIFHSTGLWGRIKADWINKSEYDVINLHWIACGLISLQQIKKIKKPIVWTLHDSWPALGREHHPMNLHQNYHSANPEIKKSKLNSYIIQAKRKIADKEINLITPSTWQASVVKSSPIFKNKDFRLDVIPNVTNIDSSDSSVLCTKKRYTDKRIKVSLLGNRLLENKMKGGDILLEVARKSADQKLPVDFIIGGKKSNIGGIEKYNIKQRGHLSRDQVKKFFVRADLSFVPSRIENLSTVAIESLKFGLPVIAFNVGGNSDIIENDSNGFLINPFDTDKVVRILEGIVGSSELLNRLSKGAKKSYTKNFATEIVLSKYMQSFRNASLNNYSNIKL